jgi:hypothetical protein
LNPSRVELRTASKVGPAKKGVVVDRDRGRRPLADGYRLFLLQILTHDQGCGIFPDIAGRDIGAASSSHHEIGVKQLRCDFLERRRHD